MKHYLSLVKFSHTVFALPFAIMGYVLAMARYQPERPWLILVQVILCMVFARNAAMAFNRLLDRDIDAKNPRTVGREIPAGVLSPRSVGVFVAINVIGFIATTYFINTLCFVLSPVALAVVLGYSYTKRFTAFCHMVLGLGLALAPVGAYLAVSGQFDLVPLLYAVAVLFWVSGFDIIYALQDEGFDKAQSLHSTPVWLGGEKALMVSRSFHVITASAIILAAWSLESLYTVQYLHWVGAIIFILLLIRQHSLVSVNDLSKVDLAFFTFNGIASVALASFVILDVII